MQGFSDPNGGMSYADRIAAAMQTLRATEPQFKEFVRGLASVLNQWTALQLVAIHCDVEAPLSLYNDLCKWHLEDGEIFPDDLEIYFEEFFDNVRSVLIEDDSMKEVAVALHDMYCHCCRDNFSPVEQFIQSEVVYRRMNPVGLSINGAPSDEMDLDGPVPLLGDVANDNLANEEEEGVGETVNSAPKQRRKKRKNNYQKTADGWNIVL